MNRTQKRVLVFFLCLFFASLIIVPYEVNFSVAADRTHPKTAFMGFTFIGSSDFEIDLAEISIKVLLIEWFALAVLFISLFFFFKDNKK